MEVIQIGSLAILLKWVLLGVAIVIGLIFIRIWFICKREVKSGKQVFDLLVNSLFIGFFHGRAACYFLNRDDI